MRPSELRSQRMVRLPKIALGTDETAMNFRRLLPEIRWQSRLSPVFRLHPAVLFRPLPQFTFGV
jgi:hypothetical protein